MEYTKVKDHPKLAYNGFYAVSTDDIGYRNAIKRQRDEIAKEKRLQDLEQHVQAMKSTLDTILKYLTTKDDVHGNS